MDHNSFDNTMKRTRTIDISWSNIDHWRKLCPHLSISDASYDDKPIKCQDAEKNELRQRLKEDGYALMDIECNKPSSRHLVAQAISDLETKHSFVSLESAVICLEVPGRSE